MGQAEQEKGSMTAPPTLMERLSGWSWRSAKTAGYEELPTSYAGSMTGITDYTEDSLVHNMLVSNLEIQWASNNLSNKPLNRLCAICGH